MKNLVVAGFVLLLAVSSVHAFELKKEYREEGVIFCTTQSSAVKVLEIHAHQGLEKAQETFQAEGCGTIPIAVLIVYTALIHEVEVDGEKAYVYAATVKGHTMAFNIFVFTSEKHHASIRGTT